MNFDNIYWEMKTDDTADVKSPSNLRGNVEKDIEKILLQLAKAIPDKWKDLAIFLSLGLEKIKEIELNHRENVAWQGFTMLKFWWDNREMNQLWYEELADAFRRIEKNNLAEKVVHEGASVAKRF